jgi:SAM-dependent methyltransferase
VVEVGCGRGGNLKYLSRSLGDAVFVGLDLCGFMARSVVSDRIFVASAEADKLPLRDASVDAVLCVESSHSYPDLGAFLAEVFRVLGPGGTFLYCDILLATEWDAVESAFDANGHDVQLRRDITPNVIRSRRGHRYLSVAHPLLGASSNFREFCGLPGSTVYRLLMDGFLQYRMLVVRVAAGRLGARDFSMVTSETSHLAAVTVGSIEDEHSGLAAVDPSRFRGLFAGRRRERGAPEPTGERVADGIPKANGNSPRQR